MLFCIPKILKNESNSQPTTKPFCSIYGCFVSQRYWKMKAIHNDVPPFVLRLYVVLYPKDTEKWKQFTTNLSIFNERPPLFCIPKILKNESNSQLTKRPVFCASCCFVSQRYWKMKAIHNKSFKDYFGSFVVLYPKDTEKWKQFTTVNSVANSPSLLFCIPKILKNESNSQQPAGNIQGLLRCFVSQRYWKMKAIHNLVISQIAKISVVLYPKDTEKWKQFTT